MNIKLFLSGFLLITGLHVFSVNAQQKVAEYTLGISGTKQAILVSGNGGEMACVNQSSKQMEIDFIAPDYSVINKAIITKLKSDKNIELKGATLGPDYIYVFAYNPKLKAITSTKVKRNSGEHSISTIKVLGDKDQLLSAFDMDGKFYFVYIPKSSTKVYVLKINGDENEEIIYETPMPNFYGVLSKNNEMLGNKEDHSDVAIQLINNNADCELATTSSSKKLYHENGIIRMTFDDPNVTHLLSFNTETRTSDYKRLSFSLDKGNTSSMKQGNSFIYKNKLFRGTMSPDQMNITILNLDSMNRINNYNIYPEENITIANSPLMEESGYSSGTSNETILKNSNQYFKHVLRGNFAITARNMDSTELELKIGGVERYFVNRGGGPGTAGLPVSVGFGIGMGGIGIGTGGMGMGMGGYPYGGYPGMGYPGNYGSSYAGHKTTYFKSVVSADSYSHLEGYYQSESLSKKSSDYKGKVFRSNYPEVISDAYTESKLVMGYYRKNGRKFILVEFLR